MEFQKFNNKFIIRIDKGEEIVENLKKFCQLTGLKLGSIVGIGAVNQAVIGLFSPQTKQYRSKELQDDYEITSLIGNISTMKGEIYLHLHINLADKKHQTFGGHLNSAVVSGTFEGVIEAIDGQVEREFNQEVGLNLYKFNQNEHN